MAMPFDDRRHAGRELATRLSEYAGRDDVLVLALPRGGVPVAYEVALGIGAPLDVFVVRKLGVPGREELAFGAIGPGGLRVLNDHVVEATGLQPHDIDVVAERERTELERRERMYRGNREPLKAAGRAAILVDDGLATGATMRAAAETLRRDSAGSILVAVPVASPATCAELAEVVDEVACLSTPESFRAVGEWYRDFTQTGDDEVCALLARCSGAGNRI